MPRWRCARRWRLFAVSRAAARRVVRSPATGPLAAVSKSYAFIITSDPIPPHAREDIHLHDSRCTTERRASRSRDGRRPHLREQRRRRAHVRRLRQGAAGRHLLGEAQLRERRAVGRRHSVPQRFHEAAREDRVDAGRAHESGAAINRNAMRHFYRSHATPADVLCGRRRVLSRDRDDVSQHDGARTRTFAGPLGALKLVSRPRAGTTRSSRSSPTRWARAASTAT